jgi:hypothetical protein
LSDGDKKRKSDEWDLREKEWTDEMRRQLAGEGRKVKKFEGERVAVKKRKFNPKKRFRLMLVCLGVLVVSTAVLWLTIFDANATYQATISMFSTIISGVIFVVNYGRDIIVTILNSLSKNSLR